MGTPRDMNELMNGSGNGALPFIGAAQRLLRMSKGLSGTEWGTEALRVKRYVKEGSGKGRLHKGPIGEHGGGTSSPGTSRDK